MTFFESELRKIFGQNIGLTEVCTIGHVCYGKVSEDLRMKAQFCTDRVADKYVVLEISVISRTAGIIDTAKLYFSDLLKPKESDSCESGFPHNWDQYPHIISGHYGTHWAVYEPKDEDYKTIADAVRVYLDMFRDCDSKKLSVKTPANTMKVMEHPDKNNPGVVIQLLNAEGVETTSVCIQYLEEKKDTRLSVFADWHYGEDPVHERILE